MKIIRFLVCLLIATPVFAQQPAGHPPIKTVTSAQSGEVIFVEPKDAKNLCDFHQQIVIAGWGKALFSSDMIVTSYLCVAK